MAAPAPAAPAAVVAAADEPLSHNKRMPFLVKLMRMLDDAKCQQWISWSPDGSSIIIFKPAAFAANVLPLYFAHANFPSFLRQLNMYDFHLSSDVRTVG